MEPFLTKKKKRRGWGEKKLNNCGTMCSRFLQLGASQVYTMQAKMGSVSAEMRPDQRTRKNAMAGVCENQEGKFNQVNGHHGRSNTP